GPGRVFPRPDGVRSRLKDLCTTNCTWSATVRMVTALVDNLGEESAGGLGRAFPTPGAMAAARTPFYRDVVRAGYRGAYLRTLARDVAKGKLDLQDLRDASP